MNKHNNQPNACRSNGERIRQDARPAESAGRAVFDRSGGKQVGRGERNKKN
jgi:hypothetical protein